VSDAATRALFEAEWGVKTIPNRACAFPTCSMPRGRQLQGPVLQGEDILQSDPNTQHVAAGLAAMDCVVVQDLFLNETAKYAHVFLPGSSFLEKDGTFTNAERRIQPVRKVMEPLNGYQDWEVTQELARAGLDWHYTHPSQIMDEIARLTPSFAG
jgi:formate dehydrogenase major subunit